MGSEAHDQLHFVLFPHLAPGHMIPMIDIAKMLAQNGVLVSIITTPINATRFKETLNRAVDSGLPINLIELKFPAEEAGFPKDVENLDMLPSLSLTMDFYSAIGLLQKPAEILLRQMNPSPDCIISDMCLPYTAHIAANLNLPRIVFNGFCCFHMLCTHRVYSSGVLETVHSESENFTVPGLSPPIRLTKQQLLAAVIDNGDAFAAEIAVAETTTYGMIINSFDELESEFIQQYKKVQNKVWCVGPVSLNNKDHLDLVQRGDKVPALEYSRCLKWLDERKPGSVLYVSFGTLCNLVTPQLIELALGLEASRKPFLWVLKRGQQTKELEKWIENEGFKERTKGRGLIVRGWVPQVVMLTHAAIGGFMTHCGWNSTLEAISAGLPMVTWPLFGDQFCNERLVVDVLKVGVKVGAEVTLVWGREERFGVMVERGDVERAIRELMEDGEESEERRKRVKELSLKAKRAMEPNGTSYLNLKCLIEDIRLLLASRLVGI